MIIKNNLIYKRETKYDEEDESIITIRVGFPRLKRFILVGYYRQWQYLGQNDDNNSRKFKEQNERFDKQTKK